MRCAFCHYELADLKGVAACTNEACPLNGRSQAAEVDTAENASVTTDEVRAAEAAAPDPPPGPRRE